MVEVQFNKSNKNPFYGLRRCLELFQNTGNIITTGQLDNAFDEVKDDKEKREMFFSLLFSVGDITAREHNIFKGVKKDSGGNANREGFWTIFNWLKTSHKKQFIKFLNAGLFNEYQCFDTLFRSRVKTSGKGKNISVEAVYDIFSDSWYRKELAKYVYSVVNGTNPYNKLLVAKFLTIPRLSKRSGHSKLLPQTKQVMMNKNKFLLELSKLVGWEYEDRGSYIDFKGYKKWRKEYNGELESVLFSTQKINEFTKDEFLTWLDRLPSQARFRVKNRILYSQTEIDKINPKPKWEKFIPWYKEWETYKEKKQEEQRVLEEKVRQGQASNEDREKLEKVKKQAKVTTGAVNFKELYESICNGSYDSLKVESFVQNKVNLPYNSLVIIDDSGSMTGKPFNFAAFLASVCLVKNPDDDARNLLGFFNNTTHWHSYIDAQSEELPNYFFRRSVAKISPTPFVDPKKSFIENYKHIRNFCNAVFHHGGTNISGIPDGLHNACIDHPEIVDALKSYPIWTIISDGEWNNLRSPEASLNDFFRRCEKYFGFKPYIIAIDIHSYGYGETFTNADRFSGIDNIMYIPSNPAQIEQFLTNFKNMDIYDVYTPLQSLHRSNRYELVRANTI